MNTPVDTGLNQPSAPTASSSPARFTHSTMGTVASLHIHDDADPLVIEAAVTRVWSELDRLEAIFSTYQPMSEISRINAGLLHPLDGSREVIDVLDACTWLTHATGGAFEPWHAGAPPDVLPRLDPSGFVKGWAAERASRQLEAVGLCSWYLSVGGDVQTRGTRPGGEPWRVAIADPRQPGEIVTVIDVVDSAVATSGTAERGEHLWDGRTGAKTSPFASMTVIGPNLTWADAFATAAFALGEQGLEWIERYPGYAALAVTHDGTILRSSGFAPGT